MDFFDIIASYLHHDRLDKDTVYSGFSYWIERYWPASRQVVLDWRKEDDDEGLYVDFEELNDEMLKLDAEKAGVSSSAATPGPSAIKRFLLEEANLPE